MVRGSTQCLAAGLLVVSACKEDARESDDLYMDDDVPSGSCMSDTGECDTDSAASDDASTAEVAGTCESTLECGDGESCIATFDGDIGEFECTASCIADRDETRWCLDDDACCNADSVCAERGYCMPVEASADTSGTGP